MLYTTFAVLFIAQIYGIEFTLAQKLTLGAMLFVTSKGIAGVSRSFPGRRRGDAAVLPPAAEWPCY